MKVVRLFRKGKASLRSESGVSLIESLVAVAILGIGVTAAITALSTGALAVNVVDQEATVQSLAQSQLAYTKSYPYNSAATTYPTVDTHDATYNPNPITIPDGYSIVVQASSVPHTSSAIQKVTATISRDGEPMLVVEDYKVDR